MNRYTPLITVFVLLLTVSLLLVPVAKSGIAGTISVVPQGFLMFPTSFVTAPAIVTPGIIAP